MENITPKAKNDGTDPKKNDGTDETVGFTTRSCYIQLVNKWGKKITNVTLTHTSDHNDVISMLFMEDDAQSEIKHINYETGWWASFDYWNVSFTDDNNRRWATPWNDRCNISRIDEGSTVQCVIDGKDNHLHIKVVDGCSFIIDNI